MSARSQPPGSARDLLFILQTEKGHRGRSEGSYSFQSAKGVDAVIVQFPPPTQEGKTIQTGRMPAAWAINSGSPPLLLVPANPDLWADPQALRASRKRVQMGFSSLHREEEPCNQSQQEAGPREVGWKEFGSGGPSQRIISSTGTSQGQPCGQKKA